MPGVVADAIIAHARADAPYEACGLLLGHAHTVRRAVPTSNLARSTTRYEVPPEEHLAAIRLARAADMVVIGAYHSHPRTAAEPSPTGASRAPTAPPRRPSWRC
jgi:proteasome lid subunit RPN8/RPN11